MESYILVDKTTRHIRIDKETGCLLIFDTKDDANKFLSKVRPRSDRENTIIVSRNMKFE